MMKRPRSFISTILLSVLLLTPVVSVVVTCQGSEAAGMTRLMDPRAGDPDEPDPTIRDSSVEQTDETIYSAGFLNGLAWRDMWWIAWRWYAR